MLLATPQALAMVSENRHVNGVLQELLSADGNEARPAQHRPRLLLPYGKRHARTALYSLPSLLPPARLYSLREHVLPHSPPCSPPSLPPSCTPSPSGSARDVGACGQRWEFAAQFLPTNTVQIAKYGKIMMGK